MGCGESFAKCFIWCFSFLYGVIGILLVAVGAIIHHKIDDFKAFFDDFFNAPALILIIVGCVAFVAGVLGYCGVCYDSKCMLYIYIPLLVLIIAAEGFLVYVMFEQKGQIRNVTDVTFNKTLAECENDRTISIAWDILQKELECCGNNGPDDWIKVCSKLPPACCNMPLSDDGCTKDKIKFNDGCKDILINFLLSNETIIIGVVIAMGVIQLLCILLSCCVFSSRQRQQQ